MPPATTPPTSWTRRQNQMTRSATPSGGSMASFGEMEPDPNWTGRYGTHVPGTGIDAGNRRVGSVDYNAFGNLQNFLSNSGEQGAAYLRSMGIMPSYNGQPLDQAMAGGPTRYDSYTLSGPGANSPIDPAQYARLTGGGVVNQPGGSAAGRAATAAYGSPGGPGGGTLASGYFNPAFGPGGGAPSGTYSPAAGYPAGGPGGGGMGGGPSIGAAGGLEEKIAGSYGGILDRGGRSLSAGEEALMANRATDTIARGTNDAIEDARLDAIRRGDTSGSSLGDVEGRIRSRGASDQVRARQDIGLNLSQQAMNNLISALGGAGSYASKRAEIEALLGSLQQEGGLQGLQFILGGG